MFLFLCVKINGKFSNVKKALLMITNCLQESGAPPTWEECSFPPPGYPPDYHSMEYHQWDHPPNPMPEDVGPFNRPPIVEEEVAFRLLCPADKVGSLIGKGGTVVRALQNETGASIKVSDPTHETEERIVVISAREVIWFLQHCLDWLIYCGFYVVVELGETALSCARCCDVCA